MAAAVGVDVAARRTRKVPPTPPSALVGRDTDVAGLRALFAAPGTRLVTLTGPPGVGKTRLAVAAAATLAERFRDGVVFVDLTAMRDPALVPVELAGVLGGRGGDSTGAGRAEHCSSSWTTSSTSSTPRRPSRSRWPAARGCGCW